jgi:hypothetical protein
MATSLRKRELASALARLPGGLPPSSTVDAFGLLCGIKPALRVAATPDTEGFLAWAKRHRFAAVADEDGYVVVARAREFAESVLSLDRSCRPHAAELGVELGYPMCCSQRVAEVGEASIDAYAREVIGWTFAGRFRLISPSGYQEGRALLSHLPCSPQCRDSLAQAERVRPAALSLVATPRASPLAAFAASI